MKHINILKYALLAVLTLGVAQACAKKEFQEITELSLERCLTPQGLSAKVDVTTGDYVTFGWDVNKDADAYQLTLYSDETMDTVADTWILYSSEVPFTTRLTADQKYWFAVQAFRLDKEGVRDFGTESNWAVFDGSVKTYAVKDNLYLEVTGRTETSISLAWSNEVSDYQEVTELRAVPVKGGKTVKHEVTSAEAAAAAATVTGLENGQEYQITLFYMSASRGAVDAFTKADKGSLITISTEEELKAAVNAGGAYYIPYSSTPLSMGTAKPEASLTLVGEVGPDGSKPTVVGKIELTSAMAAGSNLYCEGIKFDGGASSRIVEHTSGALTLGDIEFYNCDITNFQAGFFYGNNNDLVSIQSFTFDSCDIYGVPGSGGDAFDVRKTTEIGTVNFRNCTMYDGIRTLFRIDASDAIKVGAVNFTNNTVKSIATVNDGNNRGVFAIRVPHKMTLQNNLFLWEECGAEDNNGNDRCQLFQINSATYVDEITASGNYSYGEGTAFFSKVAAAAAGFKTMAVDPCYNSKGNFFQLAAQDLIEGKVGASKWWISYVEKPEDLTQNALTGAHTWKLQDASLFAGEVKNSRVRDELLLVGTEATPLNADGGINFLSATPLTRKGIPTEGYVAFKVTKPGSVDLLLIDPDKTGASVVVALYDDNGLEVQGGAVAVSANPDVQKIVVPNVSGEGTIFLYSTGAVSLNRLAWSEDVLAGDRVLESPKPVVAPVTVMEGEATEVSISWEPIDNAASYIVVFNKRAQEPQTELSFTVPAEEIAELKAGLYNFSVTAYPREDDIYYKASEQGNASFAIQPKSSGGEVVEVNLVWDFSDSDWQTAFGKLGGVNTDITNWDLTVNDLLFHSGSKSKYNTTYIQFGGKSGDMDRYFKFTAPEQGTLKVTVSNTGSAEAMDRTVAVTVGDDTQTQAGGFSKSTPGTLEYSVKAGEVVITAPVNGLCFYKIEFSYSYVSGGGSAPIEHDWDFSGNDWQTEFAKLGGVNTDITNWDLTVDGLLFHSGSKSKYNTTYIQFGGKSGDMDRYFKFTAPDQGTVKVTVSNTGSAEAMDRTVAVIQGEDTQAQAGGFGKGTPGTLEYSVKAGEVVITAPVNGLCFYRIYYTNQ